ncbi:hypothetical protein ACEK07_18600, partial [Alcanivoracaceae bacterium MT1]
MIKKSENTTDTESKSRLAQNYKKHHAKQRMAPNANRLATASRHQIGNFPLHLDLHKYAYEFYFSCNHCCEEGWILLSWHDSPKIMMRPMNSTDSTPAQPPPPFRRFFSWRRVVLLVLVALIALLLHTAWPFVFYPTTTLSFDIPAPLASTPQSGSVAGVAEVDITPPIGIPKFGYSAWARSADGFRTRLKARAFYLHGAGQTPMALVQLDLGAGSLPLQYA